MHPDVEAANVTDQVTNDPPATGRQRRGRLSQRRLESAPCHTPIYPIQGSGLSAAITGTVTTKGVVVGDFEGTSAASGFYLQDLTGDGDPATSDGIFVFTGSSNLVSTGRS